MTRSLSLALAAFALLCAPAARADEAHDLAVYGAFRAMDARVATIGYRLATTNVGLCDQRQPATGLVLSDVALYPAKQRAAAARAYSLGDAAPPVFVAAVAEASPAYAAGLRTGHAIAAIDGEPLATIARHGDGDYARMAAIDGAMGRWLADGELVVSVASPTKTVAVTLDGTPACATIFQVKASASLGAAADGRYVQVTAPLVDFAREDEELAAVLAHELAHNILRHRERLDAADIDRGLLQEFGRSARLTRATETEADRLSVWLLAGAGYDPMAAVRFWTRWDKERGKPLIASATHGRSSTRIAAIEDEIATMTAAKAADPAARPALIAGLPRN
ncbi:M48 family metallopeptidase [Flavisphingopyxis soli]|nr:M48 family metallopeptidase [Sphingorhabdus soli]